MGRRLHTGFLNELEAPLIARFVRRIPNGVQPNHLTLLSLVGAAMTAFGLVACRWSPGFLMPVVAGLFLNWVGDSFDGALARHMRRERPRVGFLIDRCADVLSFCLIILGLGLSPYLDLATALMLLVAYLLNVIYGLMRLVVDGVQLIGVGGVGATEGRLAVALWAIVFGVSGLDLSAYEVAGTRLFDMACGAALCVVIAIFARRAMSDIRRLAPLEGALVAHAKVSLAEENVVAIGRRARAAPVRPLPPIEAEASGAEA